MREIKFRAWDKREKRWGDLSSDGRAKGLNQLIKHMKNNDYQLLQYTGLKDKNGKEIYEGDILKIPETGWAKEHNASVIFKNGRFVSDFMGEDLYDRPNIEVIGNIYENPELLTTLQSN